MPVKELRGLDGLKGLGGLSDEEYKQWWKENEPYIKNRSVSYIHRLYANQVFVKKFGRKLFDSLNAQQRDEYAEAWFTQEGFDDKFMPKSAEESNSSNAEVYQRFNRMDTQAKRELLDSDYKSIEEINNEFTSKAQDIENQYEKKYGKGAESPQGKKRSTWSRINFNPGMTGQSLAFEAVCNTIYVTKLLPEAKNRALTHRNDILNKIEGGYLERQASKHSKEINQATQKIKDDYSEEDIDKAFWNAVNTENSPGNAYFNAYKGESELENLTVDDKAKYIATYATLQQYFSAEDVYTFLNNQARDYIADNQSWITKKALGVKNIGVSAVTYLAQSTSASVGYIASLARDANGDKPEVWMDIEGNIYNEKDVQIAKDGSGIVNINNESRKVLKQSTTHEALFLAGKNAKGEDLPGWQNMDYLEKVQRYNTFDDDVINSAEQNGGVSIYNTATHVGEDTESFTMETARMFSFGLVDLTLTLLPSGAGALGKGLKIVNTATKATGAIAKAGKVASKTYQVLNQARSTSGIALAYGKGVYDEALQANLEKANNQLIELTAQQTMDWATSNPEEYNNLVNEEKQRLKKEFQEQAKNNLDNTDSQFNISINLSDDSFYENVAKQKVLQRKMQEYYKINSNSEQAFANIVEAYRDATSAAFNSYLTEATKYAIVNASWRKFLFRTPVQQTNYAMKSMSKYIREEGVAGTKKWVQQEWKKLPELSKATVKNMFGGAWTNFTDEMQSDFAVGLNNSFYDNFIEAQNNGEALVKAYEDREWTRAIFTGLMEAKNSLYKSSTWRAGAAGGIGSSISVNPVKLLNVPTMRKQKRAFIEETNKLYNEGKITEAEKNERLSIYENKSFLEKLNDYVSLGGIAETYYGNKNAYRQLGLIASQVNKDLDNIDWETLKAAYFSTDDGFGTILDKTLDQKDGAFIKALGILGLLKHLQSAANMEHGEDASYAALLQRSSILKEATDLIKTIEENGELSESQKKELLNAYYSNNPSEVRSEENDEKVLAGITSNVNKLIEAQKGVQDAEQKLEEYESRTGNKIDDKVKSQLIFHMALLANNTGRISSLELEISGNENNDYTIELNTPGGKRKYLLTFGDKHGNIGDHRKALEARRAEVNKERLAFENKKLEPARQEVERARQKLEESGNDIERQNNQKELDKAEAKVRELENTQTAYIRIIDALTKRLDSLPTSESLSKTGEWVREEDGEEYWKPNPEADNPAPLSVEEDIIGHTVDLDDIRSIDEAVEKILQLPVAERARLFESIKLAIIQAEKNKNITGERKQDVFSERNFAVLEAIYNRISKEQPELLDKIKDVNTLTRRVRELQRFIDFAVEDPKALLSRLDTSEMEENAHAVALWDKHLADWYKDAYKKEYSLLTPNDKKRRTKKYKAAYQDFFNAMLNTNKSVLSYIVNHKDEYEDVYDIAAEALKYKEKLSDINEITYSLLLGGRSFEDLDASEQAAISNKIKVLNDALFANLDSDTPKAEDLLHALAVIETSELGKTFDIDGIIKGLKDIDNQRNSTFISDAEKHITSAARKRHYKVVERARQQQREEAERKAKEAEEAKKKAEAEKRSKEEAAKKAQEGDKSNESDLGEGAIDIDLGENEDSSQDSNNNGNGSSNRGTSQSQGEVVIISDLKEGSTFKDKNRKEYKVTKVADGKVTFTSTDNTVESEQEGSNEVTVASQKELDDFLEKQPGVDEIKSDPLTPISTPESKPESTDIALTDLAKEAQEKPGGEKVTIVTTPPPTQDLNTPNHEVPDVLLGYLWSEYNYQDLLNKKAGRKLPKSENDLYSHYFRWVDKNGIKLQNIVDFELGDIIRNNPNTVLYIMHVNDPDVSHVLFNVIEYTDDVKKYHNEKNGGVITGSDGKQYLIVGASGYDRRQPSQETAWRSMYTDISRTHNLLADKNSMFFISKYHTKVNKLKGGYIVQQLPKDSEPASRTVTELLEDGDRNPKKLQAEDLVWGIQKTGTDGNSSFVTINMGSRQYVIPTNEESNVGNVFLFVEGANGTMIPAKIKPIYLKEVDRETAFGKRLINLFSELTDPNIDNRLNALRKINRLLYLTNRDRTRTDRTSSQGKVIRVGDANHNVIELIDGDIIIATFNINDAININDFIDTFFNTFNPRIQITPEMLSDVNTLKELAEAGALNTDIACLQAIGAEYFINAMDSEGNPQDSVPAPVRTEINKRAADKTFVLYNGTTYYKSTEGSWYSQNNTGITTLDKTRDAAILTQIEYNQEIAEIKPGQTPDYTEGRYDYYVMKSGGEPLVYKRHKSTNFVEPLSSNESQKIINKTVKDAADKKAVDEAKKKNDQLKDGKAESDSETGERTPDNLDSSSDKGVEDNKKKSLKDLSGKQQDGTKSFQELAMEDFELVVSSLGTKYKEINDMEDLNEMYNFLKSKGIEVDNINMDLNSWLEYVKNCK